MVLRTGILIIFCLILLVSSFGCIERNIETESSTALIKVVTTIYPIANIISELGGEKVKVNYLLPAGSSPHTYEPNVEQARLVHDAQLFIYIGAGLDDWAVKLAEASGPDLVLLDLSKHVLLVESASPLDLQIKDRHDHDDCHDDHYECDHDHGPDDPHFWLDPLVVRDSICPVIVERFIAFAPEDEAFFNQRKDRYQRDLTRLHAEIEEKTALFSSNRFVAFHSAWKYFADRYKLQEIAVVAHFPGQEPSAGWLAEITRLIEDEQITAIFAEPQFSKALAETIAAESGSEVLMLDPLGGENLPGRETYVDLMLFNLSVFQKVLQ